MNLPIIAYLTNFIKADFYVTTGKDSVLRYNQLAWVSLFDFMYYKFNHEFSPKNY